jgi:hypothetical protein
VVISNLVPGALLAVRFGVDRFVIAIPQYAGRAALAPGD